MKKSISTFLVLIIFTTSTIFAQYQYSNALRIKIEGYGYSDETIVRFLDGATPNFDGAYDAWKLFSPNPIVPSIYSKVYNGDELSINSLPVSIMDTAIEIYTKVAYSGLYTVTIEEIYEFDDDFILSITNIDGEETYDITGSTTFTCVLQPNTTTPTFNFNVAKSVTTAIKNTTKNEKFKLLTKSNGHFDLQFNNFLPKDISVYDFAGRLVVYEKTSNDNYYLNLENEKQGLYIISVNEDGNIIKEKIYR